MRIALVSARGLAGEHVRFALAELGVRPTGGLVCPVDDGMHGEAVALCRARGWPFEVVESVHTGRGAAEVLDVPALLVITDGQDYTCAELIRRARARGRTVFVREVQWEQVALDGFDDTTSA